ncbi:acyltransferase [Enterobacter roggenkampii]|nr:acyltransferase [Enterobacter roggenkampii]
MNKNNEIEVLRAIGIIFVIMAHLNGFITWNPGWLNHLYSHTYFWGGVDLFFCVSGYVITKSLVSLFNETNNIVYWNNVFAFWVRRFYRLVPAAMFFLLIKVVISAFILGTKYFGNLPANVIDFVTQAFHLSNFRYYYCVNGLSECGANSIYWSLSLEEQFYILFPIAIFLLRKNVIYLLAAMIAIQFPIERPMFSLGWVIRSDAISWGCLIALLSNTKYFKLMMPNLMNKMAFRVVVVIMMLSGLAIFARGMVVPFYIGAMAIPCAVLVWLASYNCGLLFRSVRNNRTLLWIGSRSYSIYLTHSIGYYSIYHYLIAYNGEVSGKDTFRILFLGTLATVFLAEFSYRVIEDPIRKIGKKVAKGITEKSF